MNLEQLIYFEAVCKWGAISRAANALYVSQSTVSTAIAHLEKELSLTLFKRSKNGVALTEQGEQALGYIQRALTEIDGLRQYALAAQKTMESTIRIASAPSFSQCVLTGVLGKLLLSAPEIHLHIQEKLHQLVIEDLYEGRIDLGFVGYFEEEAQAVEQACQKYSIALQPLYVSPNAFYCRAGHPLTEKSPLEEADLLNYPLIICRHMHQAVVGAYTSRQILREVDNYEQIKGIIQQNDFIALLPDLFEKSGLLTPNDRIVRLALAAGVPAGCYGWIKLKANPLLMAEQKVLELVCEQLALRF